ncbi:hypothetical protein EDD18DRAFT_1067259 [Armillaria luteobubalina]|uniref:Uncharacterized protein n=1 Tax=Armillaria luteobubalina TaxID=153913 RepID=A0AA39QDV0_9AGAR|nr:hypothetical protein EDD18DRAFT_1067259 [Armillaria luteobubalina]
MQLKSYLQLNKDRPVAAYVTDAIINRNVKDERVRKDAIVNTFLQTWSAQLQKNPHLPMHIKSMLITVKELHVHLDMLAPSIKIHNQIPVWFHMGMVPKSTHYYAGRMMACLMTKHAVKTMGQAAGVAARLCKHTHKPRRDCKCTDCCKDRCRWACNSPHKCAMAANTLLDKLEPK